MKGHCPFLPYLPLFISIPLIFPYLGLGIGFATLGRVYLALWEEGAKGPEGKSSWQELKDKMKTLRCFTQGFPRKNKRLLSKKRGPVR
jgi:hypothetical protein